MPAYVPPHLRGKAQKPDKQQTEIPAEKPSPQKPSTDSSRQPRQPTSPYNNRNQNTRDPARDTSWGSRDNNRRNNAPPRPQKNSRFNGMFDGFQGRQGYNGGGHGGGYNNRRGGNRGYGGGQVRRRAQMELDTVPNAQLERELFGDAENQNMTQGINFDKYNDIPVEMSGREPPEGIKTFQDCELHEALVANITRCGYTVPTPVQKFSVPIVTQRRDLMACAQTGSGKTAAFLLPTIHRILVDPPMEDQGNSGARTGSRSKYYPRGLILAPTRELVQQIHAQARKFLYCSGMRAVCIYGGSPIVDQFKSLDCGVHLLVATPGRLWDMLERRRMSLAQCEYLVLDEADRMLDMGFEPQIRNIVEGADCVTREEGRVTLMYSATFPEEIQQLAQDFLHDYVFLAVGRVGSTTDFITQTFAYVEDYDKVDTIIETIPQCEGLKLVFTATKRGADEVEYLLNEQGYSATCIHGDKSQHERERALNQFRKGQVDTLVATDVAARGLDIPNVKWVIQYDLPQTIDDYVHRIGRTGRCGHEGTALAFVNNNNGNIIGDLLEILTESKQEIPTWLGQLRQHRRGKGRKKGRYGGRDFRKGNRSSGGRNNNYGGGRNNNNFGGRNNRRNEDSGW